MTALDACDNPAMNRPATRIDTTITLLIIGFFPPSVAIARPSPAAQRSVQRRRDAVRWNRLLADRFLPSCQKPSKTLTRRSGEVETVKVHDFVPCRHKIVQELLPGVLTSVNFRQSPELGVGTEDQVNTGAGPLELTRLAIAPFKHVRVFRHRLPLGAHIEQVHEEVIGQRLRTLGEDAMLRASEVAHSARACRR